MRAPSALARPAPVLSARGLRVALDGRTVLHGVDLDLLPGRWLAVVGPNGAGKSTLLRCLAGVVPPAGGSLTLEGRALHAWSVRERARRLAWLAQAEPQDASISPSVRDIVRLGRLPHQGLLATATATDEAAVRAALADTDSGMHADRALDALSGGERQRALLARALAVGAQVLLLDEPAAHLDAPHQRLLAGVLRREAARGTAVVGVVHDLNLALAADRIAVMASGRLLAEGPCDAPDVHRAVQAVFDDAVVVRPLDGRFVALPVF